MKSSLDISVGSDFLITYEDRLVSYLKEIPFLQIINVDSPVHRIPAALNYHDISIEISVGVSHWHLLVESKWSGEPRFARQACLSLLSSVKKGTNIYPIFAAPYISEQSRAICKDLGVGFIDLSGNCRIVFENIYISNEGFPNSQLKHRPLRSLYSAKSSRIIRLMLEDPKKYWRVQELSRLAEVSMGLASKVKQRLLDLEYVTSQDLTFRLHTPELVLKEWSQFYSYKENQMFPCYGPGARHQIEETLSKYCKDKKIKYALTLFSGAEYVAPFVHGVSQTAAYVDADLQSIVDDMNWKPVASGANILLLKPFDDFILHDLQPEDQRRWHTVVNNIQLYLDLAGHPARGEDAAQFLLDTVLEPKWK